MTPNEVAKIIGALRADGAGAYERLRARAAVLLMRFTALPISDVAVSRRDRIRNGKISIRAAKNGKVVRLPVPPELQAALDSLPFACVASRPGLSVLLLARRRATAARLLKRTMECGLQGLWHTLLPARIASAIRLGPSSWKWGTSEEAAGILGDSEAIIHKQYAKW